MKKIDKGNCLAKEYQSWVSHPVSLPKCSSKNKYYTDVFVALLISQNGLCAYTEYQLIESDELERLKLQFDESGRFQGHKPEVKAILEHFYPRNQVANEWIWENFFIVDSHTNSYVKNPRERTNQIDEILKPDRIDYDPFVLLDYDKDEHIFYAHPELNNSMIDRIENMIYILGINHGGTKLKRKQYIEENILKPSYQPYQFITAFQMIRRPNP